MPPEFIFRSGRRFGKTGEFVERIRFHLQDKPGERILLVVNKGATHEAWQYLEEVLTPEELQRLDVVGQ